MLKLPLKRLSAEMRSTHFTFFFPEQLNSRTIKKQKIKIINAKAIFHIVAMFEEEPGNEVGISPMKKRASYPVSAYILAIFSELL